jgi:septal ring factor EnvC (AmiA/AmiB activator)
MHKIVLAVFMSIIFFSSAFAQQPDKDELQRQRQQLKKEIEDAEKILSETRNTTKASMGDLFAINKKINLQDKVIDNISGEIRFLEDDIYNSQKSVNKLIKVLDTLKQEYAKSMVYAYKSRNSYDFLNFIFSASSFNDAIKRITYLKSYRNYREMQGENILNTQALLQRRIIELSSNKQRKNSALQEKSQEMSELEKQQKEKQTIVNKLKGRQKELAAQINSKKKQDAKLKNLIAIMIKREIEKAKKEAAAANKLAAAKTNADTKAGGATSKATRSSKTTSVLVSSEADKILDANFEKNRGSLPWPVTGSILYHYGRYTIPDTKIVGDNPGVTIATQVGSAVKAIFDGEVTLVTYIEDKQAVFIKHGKYFTVYSNLSSVNVQRGQKVKTSEVIGKAGANDDGQGEVSLILMKESNNVNPELWLHK